ncbi:hypothetical protein J6590_088727 [Homalodisca vitripennis]|nr:hypothetical protein J6590_099414 [Homalodisca vitripennis]KAG8251067.1 hypothetical protein J6590_088727 [Homalodisca vitripennis]
MADNQQRANQMSQRRGLDGRPPQHNCRPDPRVESYEEYYRRTHGERKPVQSGFVSSTKWTLGDSKWYKAQTVYTTSQYSSGPPQDSKVSSSKDHYDNFYLRELLSD